MKKYVNAVNYNIKHIFWFEFIFKLITVVICVPLSRYLINVVMKAYNLKFLSIYNLQALFKHFSFYFILIGLFIVIGLYFIFDLSVILLLIHNGLDKKEVSFKSILKESLMKTINVFKPKNILYLTVPCIFLLFINIGLGVILYKFTDYVHILLNFMTNNVISTLIFIIVVVILTYLFTRCIFIYNDYIINEKGFIKAFKDIKYKNNIITTIILILRKIISLVLVYFSTIALAHIFFYFREVIDSNILSSLISGLIITLLLYMFLYYSIKSEINDILYITCRYYYYNNEKVSITNDINKSPKYYKYVRYACLLVFTIFFTVIMYKINNKTIKYDFIFDYHIDITGHRGAYNYAPENTMGSFKLAYDMGADYIELDVHESKDGYIYVMHDGSLNRTLGLDKLDYRTTWNEINERTILSKFPDYQNETVPLLEDVLIWAKDKNFTLNIELKPTSKSIHLEQYVVDLIHKYNFTNKCVVASFDIHSILKVRQLDSNIKIVYLGNNLDYREDIDTYSLHYSSVTRDLVKYLHKNNKSLYVWTVNDEEIVKSLINYGVDNIITNDIPMVQNVVKKYKNKDKTNALIDFIICLYK